MRPFLNLFLSVVLPISALLIVLSVAYFMMNYDVSKALKLGTVTGFMAGVSVSIIVSIALFVMRKIRTAHTEKNHPESTIVHEAEKDPIDQKFILLMDKAIAFDVIIQSIIDQHIGEVEKGNKKKGDMTIYTTMGQHIDIAVSTLTKHTSEVAIQADNYSNSVKQIIHYIKTKEHSFLQY